MVEVCQGAGEALFVPSGWHHTVENTAGGPLNTLMHL